MPIRLPIRPPGIIATMGIDSQSYGGIVFAIQRRTSERERKREKERERGGDSLRLIKCASSFDGTFTFMAESGVSSWDL